MNQNPSTPRNFTRNLLFFSALLCALLISVWARAAQVTLAWDANTESDLAGYRIHYGTASGSYTVTVAVDKSTPTCTILNLSAGQTYYFAASAYNTSGASSGYSNEVSHTICGSEHSPHHPVDPRRDDQRRGQPVHRLHHCGHRPGRPEPFLPLRLGRRRAFELGDWRRSRAPGHPPGSIA